MPSQTKLFLDPMIWPPYLYFPIEPWRIELNKICYENVCYHTEMFIGKAWRHWPSALSTIQFSGLTGVAILVIIRLTFLINAVIIWFQAFISLSKWNQSVDTSTFCIRGILETSNMSVILFFGSWISRVHLRQNFVYTLTVLASWQYGSVNAFPKYLPVQNVPLFR